MIGLRFSNDIWFRWDDSIPMQVAVSSCAARPLNIDRHEVELKADKGSFCESRLQLPRVNDGLAKVSND